MTDPELYEEQLRSLSDWDYVKNRERRQYIAWATVGFDLFGMGLILGGLFL